MSESGSRKAVGAGALAIAGTAALIFSASCEAFGQSAPPRPAFEVASVRPRTEPASRIGISTSGPRLTAEAYTVLGLIMYAYNLKNYQISRATPRSTDDTMYDIVAKAAGEGTPTRDEFQADAAIAAGRSLQTQSSPREERDACVRAGGWQERAEAQGKRPRCRPPRAHGHQWAYDITLTYTPENKMIRGPDPDLDVSIFTALQEQLGLRLVQQKADVEILVVDRVEKPSGN